MSECICLPGFTVSDATTCQSCGAGKYKETSGAGGCSECASGTYSGLVGAVERSTCISCPVHSDSPAASSASSDCTCTAGYYSDSDVCKQCPQGKFKAEVGDEACSDCEAGKYSREVGQTSSSTCILCEAGKYGESTGRGDDCQDCAAGKYSSEVGANTRVCARPVPLAAHHRRAVMRRPTAPIYAHQAGREAPAHAPSVRWAHTRRRLEVKAVCHALRTQTLCRAGSRHVRAQPAIRGGGSQAVHA